MKLLALLFAIQLTRSSRIFDIPDNGSLDTTQNDGEFRNFEIVTDDPDNYNDGILEEKVDDDEGENLSSTKRIGNMDYCLTKFKESLLYTAYGTPPEFKKPKLMKLWAGYRGDRVSLKCPHWKGCPNAKVEWFKDGHPVVASKINTGRSLLIINKKGDLDIVDNSREDDGIYTCLISNKFGVIRHDIKVHSVPFVARAPELKPNQPGNHSIHVGANLTMKCELTAVESTYDNIITWYKHFTINGEWANKDGSVYVQEFQNMGKNIMGYDFKLVLTNITEEDEGWYTCVVKNHFGASVGHGYLNVTQPLENPDTQFPILDTMLDLFYSFIF